jgi:hypothetical protein
VRLAALDRETCGHYTELSRALEAYKEFTSCKACRFDLLTDTVSPGHPSFSFLQLATWYLLLRSRNKVESTSAHSFSYTLP